jgi:hypothetical protein
MQWLQNKVGRYQTVYVSAPYEILVDRVVGLCRLLGQRRSLSKCTYRSPAQKSMDCQFLKIAIAGICRCPVRHWIRLLMNTMLVLES